MGILNVNSKFLISTTYVGRRSSTPLLSITNAGVGLNVAFHRKYYKEHTKQLFYQLIKSSGELYLLITKTKRPCYYSLTPVSNSEGFQAGAKKLASILGDKHVTVRYNLELVPTNDSKIKAFKITRVVEDSVLSKNESQKHNF